MENKEIKKMISDKFGIKMSEISLRGGRSETNVLIKIESKLVSISAVKAMVAAIRERIDKCPYSGEVLHGCNHWVFVDYVFDCKSNLSLVKPIYEDYLDARESMSDGGTYGTLTHAVAERIEMNKKTRYLDCAAYTARDIVSLVHGYEHATKGVKCNG